MQLTLDTRIEPTADTEPGELPGLSELDRLLPHFRVVELLGCGGMGAVYKAWQNSLDRWVAIKVPTKSSVADNALARRFVREGKALAQLQHPNVVSVLDSGQVDGITYLVMEYVEGMTMAAWVNENGPAPLHQAVEWIVQVAQGLEFAHRKRIVHRDVKPSNLLIDTAGNIKILDLGLALFDRSPADDDTATDAMTDIGNVLGTLDFMSPEQALDPHDADPRSDIYSLGCTLYFLLTGQPLFSTRTKVQTILAHREQAPPSVCDQRTDVPSELDAVFQSMIAKSATQRPTSMQQVAEQLRAALEAPTSRHANATPRNLTNVARWSWIVVAFAALALLGIMVYRIQTNRGTLVVKLDETIADEVTVRLREQGVELIELETEVGAVAQPRQPARLTAGTWQIKQVPGFRMLAQNQAGVQVDTDRFTIHRGERIVVEVTVDRSNMPTRDEAEVSSQPSRPKLDSNSDGALLQIAPEHVVHPQIYTITALQFSHDARFVYISGTGGHAVMDFQKILAKKHQNDCLVRRATAPVYRAWYVGEGRTLIGLLKARDDTLSIGLFNGMTGVLQRELSPTCSRVMDYSSDGQVIAHVGPEASKVLVLDIATMDVRYEIDTDNAAIYDLEFSPDATRLAVAVKDGIQLWQLATMERDELPASTQREIAYSPDGTRLVSISQDGLVTRWNLETRSKLGEFRVGQGGALSCHHIMRDGVHAVVGCSDGKSYLVELTSGNIRAELVGNNQSRYGHEMKITSLAVTADERYAITGTSEHRCRLYQLPELPLTVANP